jgi:Flp pilus assembly protein TadG
MRQRVMTATSSMPRKIRRFGRDRRGVSAVEFAFIAPVMIGLYLGCVEISDGVAVDRKVSLVAGALANLTASCGSSNANSGSCANNILSATEMNNILAASSAIIAPYNAANLTMTVSCLSVDANKT